MANLLDILNKNPFEGVGESLGNLNIFGAEVPKQFTQMKDAGLLSESAYKAAVADADKKSKRDAIIQGLLAYGSQDFNRNTGSILPYLSKPIAVAMSAAQNPYDKLTSNVMNLEKFKEIKRKKDSTEAANKIMNTGLYKTTKDKDGNISLDVNYDILNESLKTGDIEFAKDISGILSSRASLAKANLDSLNSKYKISEKGDRVYLIPKSGLDGEIKELINGKVVPIGPNNPYTGTPDKPYIPRVGEVEPMAKTMQGLFKRDNINISPQDAAQLALEVLPKARQFKIDNPNDTRDIYTISYEMAKDQYDASPGKLKEFTGGFFGIGSDLLKKKGTKENLSNEDNISYTENNPFKGTAEQIRNLEKGNYYINPNDNRVYRKPN